MVSFTIYTHCGQILFEKSFKFLENDERPLVDASKLSTIRLKLEEKRRHIEQEKRKMEAALSKQQQKVGKAAFLQAITKVMGRFKIKNK